MTSNGTWLPEDQLQSLHESLAQAQDERILQVVATVDALAYRGPADALIAGLRPRLAQLRPGRPARFRRLLFMPLDPLIVPAGAWRPDSPTIPRTALAPLAEMVRVGMAEQVAGIDTMIAGQTTKDTAILDTAGGLIWQAAARILAEATDHPADLEVSPILARRIAALLAQEAAVQALLAEAEIGMAIRQEALCPILHATAHDATTLAMMVALLLCRLPQANDALPDAAHTLGAATEAKVRVATGAAIDVLLARLESPGGTEALIVGSKLAEAAAQARQISTMLARPQSRVPGPDFEQRRANILRRLDASCRTRFAVGLDDEFVKPLQQFGQQRDTVALTRLEEATRALKVLMRESREIGSSDIYDALLQQTLAAVKAIGTDGGLSRIDKVRLVEILAGPDDALKLLASAPGDP